MPFSNSPYLLIRGTLSGWRFALRTSALFSTSGRNAAATSERLGRSRQELQEFALRTCIPRGAVEQAGCQVRELLAEFRFRIDEFARAGRAVNHQVVVNEGVLDRHTQHVLHLLRREQRVLSDPV